MSHKPWNYFHEQVWNVIMLVLMDTVCIEHALYSAFPCFSVGYLFSLLAGVYKCSGVLFTINCNLPCEEEEFAQLFFSKSLLDGYQYSLLNLMALGMCFTDTVPNLYYV